MVCSVLLLACAASTLGGLVFGYELGVISGALLQLKTEFELSCVQQEALVSSLLIGALLASVAGGCLIDHHGRRNSILLSNVLVLSGSLVLLVSSYPALVAGRVAVGFAMSVSSMSCCIFVSEMVTAERRGFLVTLYEAGITVGILAAYAINYILSGSHRGWRWMFGFAVVPTLMQLVSIWFLPSGTEQSSGQTVLVGDGKTRVADESKVKKVHYSGWYLFQRRDNMRTRTTIGLGLVLFQQLTGQPNLLLYASTIFHSVGFHNNAAAVLASVGLGSVKVIATLTSVVFSDRVGRRPLLISGCCVMALCLVTIGLLSGHSLTDTERTCKSQDINRTQQLPPLPAAHQPGVHQSQPLFDTNTPREDTVFDKVSSPEPSASIRGGAVNWIILVCLMAVVSAYSIGFGPMTWLLLSEIFPTAVRGRAFAFANCFNWAANLLVTFTFLNVIDAIGLSGMFLMYGLTAVTAAVFFYFLLPETRGKTLEEIDEELRLNRFYHSEECCSFVGRRNTSPQYQRVHCHVSNSV